MFRAPGARESGAPPSPPVGPRVVLAIVGFALYVGAETPGSHWFGGGITHGPTKNGDVALTFDDGPNLIATVQIMRILDAAQVKGTFFEVGKAIDAEPQITAALYSDGSCSGITRTTTTNGVGSIRAIPELERTQQAFQRAIGVCPAFYRPPHGDRTPFIAHVVSDHHMRIIMWDDSSGDWAVTNPRTRSRAASCAASTRARSSCLHDGLDGNPTANREVLVQAVPLILAGLQSEAPASGGPRQADRRPDFRPLHLAARPAKPQVRAQASQTHTSCG